MATQQPKGVRSTTPRVGAPDVRGLVREVIGAFKAPRYQGQSGEFVRFSARDAQRGLNVVLNILPQVLDAMPAAKPYMEELERSLQRLNHPQLVPVLQAAILSGLPVLIDSASEHSVSLAERLKQAELEPAQIVDLITKVGNGMEYAAQREVFHGGLTPEQILIDKTSGEPMVAGLGQQMFAALLGLRQSQPKNPYLAPEQRQGDRMPTGRGDVYSLSALLYRLLVHEPPDLEPEEIVPPNEVHPDITPALAGVVMRALAADPKDRYPSVDEFMLEMRAALRSPLHPEAGREQPAHRPHLAVASDSGLPDPTAFPAPLEMPAPDMTTLDRVAQDAQAQLANASTLIPIPDIIPMPDIRWEELLDLDSLKLTEPFPDEKRL